MHICAYTHIDAKTRYIHTYANTGERFASKGVHKIKEGSRISRLPVGTFQSRSHLRVVYDIPLCCEEMFACLHERGEGWGGGERCEEGRGVLLE